jgi:hypothetical protein
MYQEWVHVLTRKEPVVFEVGPVRGRQLTGSVAYNEQLMCLTLIKWREIGSVRRGGSGGVNLQLRLRLDFKY